MAFVPLWFKAIQRLIPLPIAMVLMLVISPIISNQSFQNSQNREGKFLLTRGPLHLATAKDMEMQVIDGLPAIIAIINDHAITVT